MLNEYLAACVESDEKRLQSIKVARLLSSYPEEVLHALASGRAKLAFGKCDDGWLEKFKGSPLLQKAVELERQELEVDVAWEQARAEADALRPDFSEFDKQRDQCRLQKRLLDLELLESTQAAGMPAPTGPTVPVSVEMKQPSQPKPAASAAPPVEAVPETPKLAFGLGALAGRAASAAQPMLRAAAPLAQKAVGLAIKNPHAAGAIAGAAGGAIAGGPGNRMAGAAGGAALGLGAGHAFSTPGLIGRGRPGAPATAPRQLMAPRPQMPTIDTTGVPVK